MDFTYTGDTNERGKPHGQGVKNYASGNRYEGQWKDGKKHGQGVYNRTNGDRFEGQWKDGKRHGQGVSNYASGNRYEGQWKDGKKHGQGVSNYQGGARYEGQWKDSKRHGQGAMKLANGDRYEGQWKDGQRHGQGILEWSNGGRYEGQWIDGLILEEAVNPEQEEGLERLMRGYWTQDDTGVDEEVPVYSKRVHSVTQRFNKKLAEFDENIRNGETFSFAFDAHIEDEDTLYLFIASVREILEENGLFERSMFEHDGFLDRDANADAERGYANVTEIRYLLLSESNFPECPCCESSQDVHTIQVTDDVGGWSDMLRYKCMDACDVSFRQTFGGDIVWDMAFPHCDTCGDSDDVYEDWENGICQAQDSENEHGCGPFYCSNCDGDNSDGHRISTDGGCVDTSCECDDWDD